MITITWPSSSDDNLSLFLGGFLAKDVDQVYNSFWRRTKERLFCLPRYRAASGQRERSSLCAQLSQGSKHNALLWRKWETRIGLYQQQHWGMPARARNPGSLYCKIGHVSRQAARPLLPCACTAASLQQIYAVLRTSIVKLPIRFNGCSLALSIMVPHFCVHARW